jgi:hypothetical protein
MRKSDDHFASHFDTALLLTLLLLMLFIFLCASRVQAGDGMVTLAWDSNTEEDLLGYKLHYGLTSGSYDHTVDVGDQTSYTLTGLDEGFTYYIVATAYDTDLNDSDYSGEVIAEIPVTNLPPVADAGVDQNVEEAEPVTLSGAGSTDPDDGIADYHWMQTSGIPVTLSNQNTVQASFTSPYTEGATEVLTFELTVFDYAGAMASDTCTVTISPTNEPPVANAGSDQAVNEGEMAVLDGSGSTDPDSDTLTYQWVQTAGTGLSIQNSDSSIAYFTAPAVDPEGETFTFQLTVTDPCGQQSSDSCSVSVLPVNEPPVADAGVDQTVAELTSVTLNGSGSSDPEGGTLSFSWIQTGGTTISLTNADTATPSFTAPDLSAGEQQVLTFQLTVTDDGTSQASDTCSVTVTSTNEPPVADAGPDLTVDELAPVSLNGSGSTDPEGDILEYLWTQVSGTQVNLSNADSAVAGFTAPQMPSGEETLVFELTVRDSSQLASSDTCSVVVSAVNDPPTADAGPDQTINEYSIVTLNGTNSTDPDDGIVSYSWIQTGGDPVVLQNPDSDTATFATPDGGVDGKSFAFQLTVRDASGLEGTDSCIVNVSWVNQAPTADAGADQTVDEGLTVQLDATGSSDPDDGIGGYLWTQKAGTAVELHNPDGPQPWFTAPDVGSEGGSAEFELTLTDTLGLQSTDSCIVNVSWVNQPPQADAGPDNSADERNLVQLDGTRSFDPDDGIARYRWNQKAGPPVTLSDPTVADPTFESPEVSSDGDMLTFELIVEDTGGLQSADGCSVAVNKSSGGCDVTGTWGTAGLFFRGPKSWVDAAFTVQNVGDMDAQCASVEFFYSADSAFDTGDEPVYDETVGILGPGQSVRVSFTKKLPDDTTSGCIIAIVHSGNPEQEPNGDNNVLVSSPIN